MLNRIKEKARQYSASHTAGFYLLMALRTAESEEICATNFDGNEKTAALAKAIRRLAPAVERLEGATRALESVVRAEEYRESLEEIRRETVPVQAYMTWSNAKFAAGVA